MDCHPHHENEDIEEESKEKWVQGSKGAVGQVFNMLDRMGDPLLVVHGEGEE